MKYIPVSKGEHLTLGGNTTAIYKTDPKLLCFTLAKYKFVAKMLDGFNRALEIGCADGFGVPLVAKSVKRLDCIDAHSPHIVDANVTHDLPNVRFIHQDFLAGRRERYDGIYCLDVLEHIEPSKERTFLKNIIASLNPGGVCIIGMPSTESQQYAGEWNKGQHINCQSEGQLRATLRKHFANVFSFGFNDEVLHTGYGPMRQYLMMLCVK